MHATESEDFKSMAVGFWSEGSYGLRPEGVRYLEEQELGFPLGMGLGRGSTSVVVHGLKLTLPFK